MLGSNIKVHFAGSDANVPEAVARDMVGVKYDLFSCYPFIKSKKLSDDFKFLDDQVFVQRDIQPKRNHIIMDSGLFTLMFGAGKGQKQTKESLEIWQDKTAKFVSQNNIHATCVEIDCQKVLGVEEAWYFRERMRKVMPNNRHINVFHLEDGQKGLDRLIEFSDYIAISVPELRIHKKGTFRKDTIFLANYIKNKKPNIDIHLLGCTDRVLLKECNFCTSADSTSWITCVRYGRMPDARYHERDIKASAREVLTNEILKRFKEYKKVPTGNDVKRTQTLYYAAKMSKKKYEELCGPQD